MTAKTEKTVSSASFGAVFLHISINYDPCLCIH